MRGYLTDKANNSFYTPPEIGALVRDCLGVINLDPCSSGHPHQMDFLKAQKIFTEQDNALDKSWYGNVFMNPPYNGSLFDRFVVKLIQESTCGNVKSYITLCNNNTDRSRANYLMKHAKAVVFTKGRISFYSLDESGEITPKCQNGRGQMFTYWGDNPDKFLTIFTMLGVGFRCV